MVTLEHCSWIGKLWTAPFWEILFWSKIPTWKSKPWGGLAHVSKPELPSIEKALFGWTKCRGQKPRKRNGFGVSEEIAGEWTRNWEWILDQFLAHQIVWPLHLARPSRWSGGAWSSHLLHESPTSPAGKISPSLSLSLSTNFNFFIYDNWGLGFVDLTFLWHLRTGFCELSPGEW